MMFVSSGASAPIGVRLGGRLRTGTAMLMLAGGVASLPAVAQDVPAGEGGLALEEIVVTADRVGLAETRPTDTLFGLSRTALETPRAISVVSDTTIERYSIEDINDFITTTPGTFTGSFFGVPGAVSIRGTTADNYFRGFRRVENRGTFPTPIGASERIEIVRGPVSPIFGAGKVGGFLNFYPKTVKVGRQVGRSEVSGNVAVTVGSYDKKELTAELGVPFDLGTNPASINAYVEREDSGSFYRGIDPERTLVQLAGRVEFDAGLTLELGGMYFKSDGYKQTPGWNRVTQDLIDNGTYITGYDTDLKDSDGNGKLTPGEVDAVVGSWFGTSNIRQLVDYGGPYGPLPAAFELDTNVGTAKLSRRTVFVADEDIAESETRTGYLDLTKEFDGGGKLKAQLFTDSMDADLYVSYGYAGQYSADVYEGRLSYSDRFTLADWVSVEAVGGLSYRNYDSTTRQSFLSGYLVLDRRDLTVGPQANDIFDSPFSQEAGGLAWDTDLDSTWSDTGLFTMVDLKLFDNLSLLLGARYDWYDVESINRGATIFNPSLGFTKFKTDVDDASYNVSVSYTLPFGVVPYITYVDTNALETNDAGSVEVDRIAQGNVLAPSELWEFGTKFELLDRSLFGSINYYRQERTRLDAFGNVDGETSRGYEAELRYLITDNWSATGAATWQKTKIDAPGVCGSNNGEYVVVPPSRLGIDPASAYGGIISALNASCLVELQNGYQRRSIPERVFSSFLTYTSEETSVGTFGATVGGTYVSETGGKLAGAFVLPDYTLFRLAMFYEYGNVQLIGNVDNLFDKTYFVPVQNVYEEVAVLPGKGREFKITAKYSF